MAGEPHDGFLFPGRDGVAVPHLRRQLEDPAERIHRARAIRRRVRLSRARHADRPHFDRPERTQPEPLIMVNILEMPETISTPTVRDAAAHPAAAQRSVIEIDNLDFSYGNNHVLHDISLEIPGRAVTAF